MAIDFTHGYAASWRVDRVDPSTWEPRGALRGVDSIAIDRDGTDKAGLLESAALTVTSQALEAFEPGWYRVTMDATQGTYSQSVPVATLWLEPKSGTYDKGYRSDTLEGRSVLRQASESVMGDGAYAPKGADGAAWAANALAACIDAPVSTVGGFELADSVVFDLGASVLSAAWAVLRSADWCIFIDGRGEVSIAPLPTEPALRLDRNGARIMQPSVTHRDGKLTYKREWMPNVHPFSLVYGALPERGLDGLYRVRTQKLACSMGIVVEESVMQA